MVCSPVDYNWQAFHITHRPGFFLIEKKKNNGANIFLFRRKAVPQFLLLWRLEACIPWGAVECGIGNLNLAKKYAVCNWYLPDLKQTEYNKCLPVQWLFQVNAFREFSMSQVARLGLTKERRNWFALLKSLMYKNETLRSLFS